MQGQAFDYNKACVALRAHGLDPEKSPITFRFTAHGDVARRPPRGWSTDTLAAARQRIAGWNGRGVNVLWRRRPDERYPGYLEGTTIHPPRPRPKESDASSVRGASQSLRTNPSVTEARQPERPWLKRPYAELFHLGDGSVTEERLAAHASERRLVAGLINRREFGLLYGDTGEYKSFLLIHLLFHISLGKLYYDREVVQAPTVYIGLEGDGGVPQRVAAAAKVYGHAPLFHASRVDIKPTFVKGPEGDLGVQQVLDLCARIQDRTGQPVGAVGIDTLAKAIAGNDENSPADMSRFLARMEHIAQATGATVIGTHHPNRQGALRGSNAAPYGADFLLPVKGGLVTIEKCRDGLTGPFFRFAMTEIVLGAEADGRPITSLAVGALTEPDQPKEQLSSRARVSGFKAVPPKVSANLSNLREAFAEAAVVYEDDKIAYAAEAEVRQLFSARYRTAGARDMAWMRAFKDQTEFGKVGRNGVPCVRRVLTN